MLSYTALILQDLGATLFYFLLYKYTVHLEIPYEIQHL